MKNTYDKIIQLIKSPQAINEYSNTDWNQLVSQARYHDLLPFVYRSLESHELLDNAPAQVIELLAGYRIRLEFKHAILRWEAKKLNDLIAKLEYSVVLLKGMAYLQDCVSTYASRDFADIDLLVPQEYFAAFEKLLLENGWDFKEMNSYDEHYYKQWSHASPPLVNRYSGLELDLHHHISSPIKKDRIDSRLLLADIKRVRNSNFFRLSDIDVILHCANHFIYLDILQGRLKDLIFIYFLISEQSSERFWLQLNERARQLGLEITLYYLIRLLAHFFGKKSESENLEKLKSKRDSLTKNITFICLKSCICPHDPESFRVRLAEIVLLIRYQWTRYPVRTLAYHIFKKHIYMRVKSRFSRSKEIKQSDKIVN